MYNAHNLRIYCYAVNYITMHIKGFNERLLQSKKLDHYLL